METRMYEGRRDQEVEASDPSEFSLPRSPTFTSQCHSLPQTILFLFKSSWPNVSPTYTRSFPLFSVALLDPMFNAQENIMETGNMLGRAAQRQKTSE